MRLIGDTDCTQSSDCHGGVAHSDCINGMCQCSPGYYPSDDNTTCTCLYISDDTCLVVKMNASACTDSSFCSDWVDNSYCVDGVCQCMSGYQAMNDSSLCEARQIGDPCSSDSDCADAVENAFCEEVSVGVQTCQCLPGYLSVSEGTTCQARALGDACATDEDCSAITGNTTCSENGCSCAVGFAVVGESCGLGEYPTIFFRPQL